MHLLDLIFPKRCVGCGKVGKYFCNRCTSIIQIIEVNEAICPVCEKPAIDGKTHPKCQTRYAIDGLTSFFHYDGPIRKAVKAIKYRYVSDLSREFIRLIPSSYLNKVAMQQFRNVMLVPVPLHPSRLRFRGFNQAEVLGKLLAARLPIPIQTNVLMRVKKTTAQVEMKDKKERLQNVEGVFSILSSTMNHKGSTVFLFDDVFTTGATMRSAASVLKHAGAKFVWGITMAR